MSWHLTNYHKVCVLREKTALLGHNLKFVHNSNIRYLFSVDLNWHFKMATCFMPDFWKYSSIILWHEPFIQIPYNVTKKQLLFYFTFDKKWKWRFKPKYKHIYFLKRFWGWCTSFQFHGVLFSRRWNVYILITFFKA